MLVSYQIYRSKYGSQGAICHWASGSIWEIKQEGDIAFCCDEMEYAWENSLVGWGENDSLNQVTDVCIYKCFPWPEGIVWEEYPIKFCPWCAEKIELEQLVPDKYLDHSLKEVPGPTLSD